MTTFPCRSDDFCVEHGYDHMRIRMGDPVPFCEACEEKETMTEQEALFTAAQLCNKYSLDYSPQGDCCDVLYSILFQEYIARALQDAWYAGFGSGAENTALELSTSDY